MSMELTCTGLRGTGIVSTFSLKLNLSLNFNFSIVAFITGIVAF